MKSDKLWTIPYIDQPISFWNEIYSSFGKFIDEVYVPLPSNSFPSGRPHQPERHILDFLKHSPFNISLLLNPIIFPRPIDESIEYIFDNLMNLQEKYKINSLTISNLTLAKMIKSNFPNIKLIASVLIDIFTLNQLEQIKEVFDVIVPSPRILRNKNNLLLLKNNFKGKIKLIVNEGCIPNCVYRVQHFYEMGSNVNSPKSLCEVILKEKPWISLTGSWILPQHIYFFEGLFDKLKLSGRVTLQNPKYYRDVLSSYIFRKKLLPNRIGGGPVTATLDFDIPDNIFQKLFDCDKNCVKCDICKHFYELHKH